MGKKSDKHVKKTMNPIFKNCIQANFYSYVGVYQFAQLCTQVGNTQPMWCQQVIKKKTLKKTKLCFVKLSQVYLSFYFGKVVPSVLVNDAYAQYVNKYSYYIS